MKKLLLLESTKSILLAIGMMVFGIIFIANPNSSFNTLVTVLGWILVILGILGIVFSFIGFKSNFNRLSFINSFLIVGFGFMLLYVPTIYITIIGLALAFSGIQYIGISLEKCSKDEIGWWKDLIYGLVQFVLGAVLVILRYSSVASEAIMIYLGIMLIVDSLFILAVNIFIKRGLKYLFKNQD